MEYIESDKSQGCFLCAAVAANPERDRANLLLHRGSKAFIIFNRYPYTNGHLMVAPYQHTANLEQLDEATLLEIMTLFRLSVRLLTKLMHPEGFNAGINLGKVAGAGMADHVHLHVVPRWLGDTSFMNVTGDTRLIPELLETTYDKLKALLNQELEEESAGPAGKDQA
jgi:ATP adenylyltransferase